LKARARVEKKKRREVFSPRAFYASRIDRVACSNTTGRLIIIIIVVEEFRCGKETRFENAGDDAIDDADADDGRGVWSESHHHKRRRRNVDSSDHV